MPNYLRVFAVYIIHIFKKIFPLRGRFSNKRTEAALWANRNFSGGNNQRLEGVSVTTYLSSYGGMSLK
nr:MAG TPA: hypothetical protein [Microviridae sp.]